MKFLIDAQLPKRLAELLRGLGYDVKHTLDLPRKNLTSDEYINELSVEEQRIVVTKDSDFVNSFWLEQKPFKLLLISTGNISNNELEKLIHQTIGRITDDFGEYSFIELNRTAIIIHS